MRKYYCSRDCQVTDWKNHRVSCRHPNDLRPKDVVRINGLKSKPEFNGLLVSIVGPATKTRRFMVTISGLDLSFSCENLTMIIPAEEVEKFSIDKVTIDDVKIDDGGDSASSQTPSACSHHGVGGNASHPPSACPHKYHHSHPDCPHHHPC